MSQPDPPRLVVVLGMHRSGTSALTRALQVFGVGLGSNLLPPAADNAEGFWEDRDVIALNMDLLASLGHDWDTLDLVGAQQLQAGQVVGLRERAAALLSRKLADAEIFGMKDPRIARLLPFWQDVFEQLRVPVAYVLSFRNPLSVAASLARRNAFPPSKSYYLWAEHVVPAVLGTRGTCRVVVSYDQLLEQPENEIRRMAAALRLGDRLSIPALEEYRRDFLKTSLRHELYLPEDVHSDPALPRLVAEVFDLLASAALDRVSLDALGTHAAFERFGAELVRISPALREMNRQDAEIAALRQGTVECEGALGMLRSQLEERDRALTALLQSRSWRWTAPLRRVAAMVRGSQ